MAASRDKDYGKNDVAGAILGHGRTTDDDYIKFVVIPEGIELRPLSKLGCDLSIGPGAPTFGEDDMYIYSEASLRSGTWEHDPDDEIMGHIYKPGDVIYNMHIHFRFTWHENNPIEYPKYYTTGIVTFGRLKDSLVIIDSRGRELNKAEIADALHSHDKKVIPDIWDRHMTLGEILHYLSAYRQQRIEDRIAKRVAAEGNESEQQIRAEESMETDRYYVVSCRGLGGRDGMIPEIECFPSTVDPPEPTRPRRRAMSDAEILRSFTDDMDFISRLVRRSRHLDELYQRIRARLDENNTMSKEDFCEIKRHVELLKRDRDTVRQIDNTLKERVRLAANRTRFCNLIEVLRLVRENDYNVDERIHPLIESNIPKNKQGGRIQMWISYLANVVDDKTYHKAIKGLEIRIHESTQMLEDQYECLADNQIELSMNMRVKYAANRTRLCNLFRVMRELRERRYNITSEFNELILSNIPTNTSGVRNEDWIGRAMAVVDNPSLIRFISILQKGIEQYTSSIGDEYQCRDPDSNSDGGQAGGTYYQMYMENRMKYLFLR